MTDIGGLAPAAPPEYRIAAVDVAYADVATVACLAFDEWSASEAVWETCFEMSLTADYVPGQFYKRELPCILRALEEVPGRPEIVIVDGYVWLDEERSPGLGAHLWRALDESVTIVGVAKNPLKTSPPCVALERPSSRKPLFVSAAGMTSQEASRLVSRMHGQYRFPTLLRRVDHLCRGLAEP